MVGLARRRRGRGGREYLDRGWTTLDEDGIWDRVSTAMNDLEEESDDAGHDVGTLKLECQRQTSAMNLQNPKLANGLPNTMELSALKASEW